MRVMILLALALAGSGALVSWAVYPDTASGVDRGDEAVSYDRLSVAALMSVLAREKDRSAELEARRGALLRNLDAKNEAARDVIAGRRTLPEAAAVFRGLYDDLPVAAWLDWRATTPAGSDEECLCRAVIAQVAILVASYPDEVARLMPAGPRERATIVPRLEAELREHLRHGPMRLPGGTPRRAGPAESR